MRGFETGRFLRIRQQELESSDRRCQQTVGYALLGSLFLNS